MSATWLVVFGNSGSGKTTLAKRIAAESGCTHLDLDTVAWLEADPPTRNPIEDSMAAIDAILARHSEWVIEGCYASLISHAAISATHMVFLNPGTFACIAHCQARPWERDKYPSKEAHDKNLAFLIDWVNS